jgi:hypothetical protein
MLHANGLPLTGSPSNITVTLCRPKQTQKRMPSLKQSENTVQPSKIRIYNIRKIAYTIGY